jgi:hypothetical protein
VTPRKAVVNGDFAPEVMIDNPHDHTASPRLYDL